MKAKGYLLLQIIHGPLFILSSVGISLFGDTKTGLLLLCTHILACITVGVILGKFSKKSDGEFRKMINLKQTSKLKINKNSPTSRKIKYKDYETIIKQRNNTDSKKDNSNSVNVSFKNLGEVLGNSINNSISTILLIGGFVVIFSVVISILNQTHALDLLSKLFEPILSLLGFDLSFAKPLLSGILELTNGVNLVSSIHIKAISQNIILCAFLLGFGGFSVLLQVFSIVSKTDLSMKKYFIGKLMQGIFAGLYTFLTLRFIPFINLDITETSTSNSIPLDVLTSNTNISYTFFYDFGIFVIGVILVLIIFYLFKRFYEKVFG